MNDISFEPTQNWTQLFNRFSQNLFLSSSTFLLLSVASVVEPTTTTTTATTTTTTLHSTHPSDQMFLPHSAFVVVASFVFILRGKKRQGECFGKPVEWNGEASQFRTTFRPSLRRHLAMNRRNEQSSIDGIRQTTEDSAASNYEVTHHLHR